MPAVGDVLGHRYQIKARIGTGGFAELYLGEDLVDGKEVAIKAQVATMTSNALKVRVCICVMCSRSWVVRMMMPYQS